MTTLNLIVESGNDDAYEAENNTGFQAGQSILNVYANTSAAGRHHGGMRFTGGPPQGSIIHSAVMTVSITSVLADDPNILMYFEDADAPANFATNADVASRTSTAASVAWAATGLGTGDKNSPDLAAPLQAVVDRPGYTDTFCALWKGQNAANSPFQFRPYEASSSLCPRIAIDFTAPPACVLQLESDAGLYEDTAASTAAEDESDPIQLWQDQSGNANHASNETEYPSLTLNAANGHPAVVFNRTHWLNLANAASLKIAGSMTCFAVVAFSDWADTFHNTIVAKGPHDVGLNYLFGKGSSDLSNTLKFTWHDGSWQDVTDSSNFDGADDEFYLVTWVVDLDNGSVEFRVNGSEVATATGLTLTYSDSSDDPGRIGANTAGDEGLGGRLAAVVLWTGALSGAELAAEEARLTAKFFGAVEPAEGSGSITGTATLTGVGYAQAAGSGSITGAGSIVGTGYVQAAGSGSITAAGSLVGAGAAQAAGAGSITAVGQLVGAGYAQAAGSGVMTGTATLIGAGATSAPPRVLKIEAIAAFAGVEAIEVWDRTCEAAAATNGVEALDVRPTK